VGLGRVRRPSTRSWLGALVALFATAPAAPVGAAVPSLRYYGGPVMHAARIVVVDYGSGTYGTGTPYTTDDPSFFTTMAAASGTVDPVWAVLAEYPDTTGPAAYDWTYVNQFAITPSAANNGATITNDQLQSELKAQVSAGNLPAPAGDGLTTLYVVNFPAGKTINLNGSLSGVQFCAYHWSAAYNAGHLITAILPNVSSVGSGCGGLTDIRNHELVEAHEVAEAINDPLVGETSVVAYPLAWYDPANGEIADICNAAPATNLGFTVQKVWSNAQSACVSSGAPHFAAPTASFTPPSATATRPAGFTGSGSSSNASDATSYGGVDHTIAAGIASYGWDFGDGTTGSGQTVIHTYANSGPVTVGLAVRDNLGFRAAASKPLTVGDAPPPPPPPDGGDATPSESAPSSAGVTTPSGSGPGTTTAPPAPTVTITGRARLVARGSGLTLDTGRRANCPAGTGSCTVSVSVTAPTSPAASLALAAASAVTYGRTTLTFAPGRGVGIRVRLSQRVRKLIRRGRLRVTVRLLLSRGTGVQQPLAFTLSLRAAAVRRG